MRAVGADACRGGWVAVLLDDGRVAGVATGPKLAPLLAAWPGAAAVGVDMPLGLVASGWRAPDTAARKRLGSLRSRVFEVPPRRSWEVPGYDRAAFAQAVACCRELNGGKGFSIQAWGLKRKLLEANELAAGDTRNCDAVPYRGDAPYRGGSLNMREVHPELSFAAMNGDVPVAAGKKTWAGQMTRRALLSAAGIELPANLPVTPPGSAAGLVPPDDILDAAAVAWSAHRIATGQARSLPDPPARDDRDQEMAIWF